MSDSPRRLQVRLEHDQEDRPFVGTLGEHEGEFFFEFDPEFLRRGLSLSPFKLKLVNGLQRSSIPHSVHGLFRDSLPDYWGTIVMDRHFTRMGRNPKRMNDLDRLAYLGRRTLGALTYHPCSEPDSTAELIDLSRAATEVRAIYQGAVIEELPEIRRAAGPTGGARPKLLVGLHGDQILAGVDDLPATHEPWLIKFAAPGEDKHPSVIEFVYSQMARAAGIDMPETRLFPLPRKESCFGVRRFDRQGNARRHMHTLANLLHVDIARSTLDYRDLLGVTAQLTRDHTAVAECFRRMIFNLLTHNRDDHAKNFSYLMDRDGKWRLAPAYDLTFVEGIRGEHWMSFDGEGRDPTWSHLQKLGREFGLEQSLMMQILEEVRAAVARWSEEARAVGLPVAHIRDIQQRLVKVAATAELPPPTRKPSRSRKKP